MAALGTGLLQGVEQRPLDPHGVVEIAARLLNNGVHALEPEAWNLAQPERTFPQQLHTTRPEVLIDFHGRGGGHLEGGQKGHQVTHDLALRVAGFDLLQAVLCDASDLQQLLRLVLQDVEGLDTKPLYDGVGGFGPDAFQQAGGEISPDALNGGRYDLMPTLHLKLAAIFALGPGALQLHLDGIRLGQVVAHSHKPDQMVAEFVGASGVLRNHQVCGFQPQDTVFAGLIAKQCFVKCRDNAHLPHLSTPPVKRHVLH